MIQIKKIKSKGFYIFQGRSCANSVFIEDLLEAKEFLVLANYYFRGYLQIYEYLLSKDGWIMIVKISSLDKLKSRENNVNLSEDEVWRVVSERVRIFLSRFVKYTNKKQGRTGGKVHSSYERYLFRSLSEAREFVKMLKNRMVKLYQSKRKYRGKKSHYKIPRKLGMGSIFLSSKGKKKKFKKLGFWMDCLNLKSFNKNVVSKEVFLTLKNHHFNSIPQNSLE